MVSSLLLQGSRVKVNHAARRPIVMSWREISWPGCGRVLLRQVSLDSFDRERSRDAILSAEELRRASHFRRERDRRRFVAGRTFVRECLGELLGVGPDRIVFGAGAFGRPEILAPATSLSFSLAHAGGQALLAVASNGRVGVDIEEQHAAPNAEALAPRALAPEELEQFHARPAGERESFFLERWTAKEALLKAAGIGFSCDPASLALARDPGGFFTGSGEPRIAGLRARLVDAGPGWIAALAIEAEEAA